jgi:NAD(P)-dependent dehydrogenase (short-subunit alcohol dehydrogenase family)
MASEQKSAIVTGGMGELGRVVAEEFLRNGMRVAVPVRPGKTGQTGAIGGLKNALLIEADLTKEEDVGSLFHSVTGKYGGVDILINAAGGYLPRRPVSGTSLADWDGMMDLNLRTMFLCSREFLRQKPVNRYGRIISIAAMPALKPAAETAAYAVSKSGVVLLTKIIAAEVKETGITANAIAPGIIDTAPNRSSMPDADTSGWVTPAEIARTMLFLVSPDARSINGQCLEMFGRLS